MTEIIREALTRSGYEATVEFLPWKRALASAQNGKHDGLFTVWYRPEREEWFLFSDPLLSNTLVFFKRTDNSTSTTEFADLKDQTIGVVVGYAPPPGFDEAGLNVSPSRDDEENLRKLHKGQVDLVLVDLIVAQHLLNRELSDLKDDLDWIEQPVLEDKQYIVFSKKAEGYEKMHGDFNTALTEMTDDGTLQSIMAKRGF